MKRRRRKFPEPEEAPADGRITHGGYQSINRYRERALDLRRVDDRAIKNWQNAIVADCGGPEKMDAFQYTLLDQCTECMIILAAISEYVTEHGIMDENTGDVVPCLRSSYTMYLQAFKTTMSIIFDRAGKKMDKAPEIPNLGNYIEAEYGDEK